VGNRFYNELKTKKSL